MLRKCKTNDDAAQVSELWLRKMKEMKKGIVEEWKDFSNSQWKLAEAILSETWETIKVQL